MLQFFNSAIFPPVQDSSYFKAKRAIERFMVQDNVPVLLSDIILKPEGRFPLMSNYENSKIGSPNKITDWITK
jgi:hypothetical protein